jgi:hypothetical protein
MLALLSSPGTMPRLSFDMKPAKTLRGAALTDFIWNLHSILVNPASKLDEVKSAKQRMLRVLDGTTKTPLPQMVVAAATPPPQSGEEGIELPANTTKRPVTPAFARSWTTFTKKARASSSRSFRAKPSDTRSRSASAPGSRNSRSH